MTNAALSAENTTSGRTRAQWEEAATARNQKGFYTACKQVLGKQKDQLLLEWATQAIPEEEQKALKKTGGTAARARDILAANDAFYEQKWAEYEPWTEQLFQLAARRAPHGPILALQHATEFASQPWAEALLIEAARKKPEAAFLYFDEYAYKYGITTHHYVSTDTAQAEDALRTLYMRHEENALTKSTPEALEAKIKTAITEQQQDNADKQTVRPWAKNVLLAAADSDPAIAEAYRETWQGQPFAAEIEDTITEAKQTGGPRQGSWSAGGLKGRVDGQVGKGGTGIF